MARAYLGDADGTTEMEIALRAFLESGEGRDSFITLNNLAIARYPLEGSASSLAAFDDGITFCQQRGLVEGERLLGGNRPVLLAELGRADEALAEAVRLGKLMEAGGQLTDLAEVRSVELLIGTARGLQPDVADVEALLHTANQSRHIDVTTFAQLVAAGALATAAPDKARTVLTELAEESRARRTPYYGRQLVRAIRAALDVADRDLAERLVDRLEPRYPLDEHAVCAARACLAEHAGKLDEAASLYRESAQRWQNFGNVPERAYALLGQGRCLRGLGRTGAEEPLLEARELFASMGYAPALGEVEDLLRQPAPTPAS
jgi:tetratricopeptide (TPR) repeat protein